MNNALLCLLVIHLSTPQNHILLVVVLVLFFQRSALYCREREYMLQQNLHYSATAEVPQDWLGRRLFLSISEHARDRLIPHQSSFRERFQDDSIRCETGQRVHENRLLFGQGCRRLQVGLTYREFSQKVFLDGVGNIVKCLYTNYHSERTFRKLNTFNITKICLYQLHCVDQGCNLSAAKSNMA